MSTLECVGDSQVVATALAHTFATDEELKFLSMVDVPLRPGQVLKAPVNRRANLTACFLKCAPCIANSHELVIGHTVALRNGLS